MKGTIAAAAILLSIAATATARERADLFPPPENLFAPPADVSRWIGIRWVGDMNHPIISVFYTVERGKRPYGSSSRYVTLTRAEYRNVQDFVHSRHCSQDKADGKPPFSRAIAVDELAHGQDSGLCIFSPNRGCDFLFRLATLAGIDWSHKDTYPLFQFEAELGCKEPLTKSHDSDGRSN
jgi:hypothetical protein